MAVQAQQAKKAGPSGGGIMGFFAKAAQQSDIAMAVALIGMISMLILPLPEAFLDLGLVLNLAGAVLILLTALYTTEPLQFSVFPALLLMTTLFRLALEVSAMKLIIGTGSAGQVIATFGQVVIGGNYVVGIIVFLLLSRCPVCGHHQRRRARRGSRGPVYAGCDARQADGD